MEKKSSFDFSEDAQIFKKQLGKCLKEASAAFIRPLEDDELEFLNAAGLPRRTPSEEESSFIPPQIP